MARQIARKTVLHRKSGDRGQHQHLHEQAEIRAAAEIDAALLADDLPPEAYGDPGFGAYLKQPEP